jgi:hypothetical protein
MCYLAASFSEGQTMGKILRTQSALAKAILALSMLTTSATAMEQKIELKERLNPRSCS